LLKTNLKKAGRFWRSGTFDHQEGSIFIFLSLCFLAGSVLGSFVGSFSVSDDIFLRIEGITAVSTEAAGYWSSLWNCTRYHILLLLFASSVLGVLFIPILSVMRGYFLSCTAASILCSYPQGGWLLSFAVLGIPALITIPCFFVLGIDSFTASGRLLSLTTGGTRPTGPSRLLRHFVVCLALLTIAAALEELLIPDLVSMLL
jgi:hypothetical protein